METHKATLARYRRAPIHRAYRARLASGSDDARASGASVAEPVHRFETMCPYCGDDSGTLMGTFEVSGREHVAAVALTRSGYHVPNAEGRTTDLQVVECSACHASIDPLAYIAPTIFLAQRDGLSAPPGTRRAGAAAESDRAPIGADDIDDEGDETDADAATPAVLPAQAMALSITYVPHASIEIDETSLLPLRRDTGLRASIRQLGVTEPLTLVPRDDDPDRYVLLAGGRKWSGAEGVQDALPAIIRRDLTDVATRLFYQLTSNHAKPLTPIEEARRYAKILDVTGLSMRDVARRAGVPRSTVSDRVRLLDLGPWVPLIEDGTLPVAIAAEHLLFLRRAPEAVHQQALDRVRQFPAWIHSGGALPALEFSRLVIKAYTPFVYPLTDTDDGGPQPAFDTSDHRVACSCDGVPWPDDSWNGTRCVCINPAYWQPRLDRAQHASASGASAAGARPPHGPGAAADAELTAAARAAEGSSGPFTSGAPHDDSDPEPARAPDAASAVAHLDADPATLAGLLSLVAVAAGATLLDEARTLGIAALAEFDTGPRGRAPRLAHVMDALRAVSLGDQIALLVAVARRAREGRIRALSGRGGVHTTPLRLVG